MFGLSWNDVGALLKTRCLFVLVASLEGCARQ
jgi:hypothetical protein